MDKMNLYPSTKFLFVLFVIFSALLMQGYGYALLLACVVIVISFLAGIGKRLLNLVVKALLPIILLIFLLQAFFYPGETVLLVLGPFSIMQEGIDFSLNLTSKLLAIGSSFILFFQTTKVKDSVYALERVGLHPKATYVVLATLQMIPEIRRMSTRIMEAQKARGVETEGSLSVRAKALLPTLTPLILASFASTEERAVTLESRAFTAKTKKTSLYHLEKTKADRVITILLMCLLILVIVWRVIS